MWCFPEYLVCFHQKIVYEYLKHFRNLESCKNDIGGVIMWTDVSHMMYTNFSDIFNTCIGTAHFEMSLMILDEIRYYF